jgi:hypothetical protein
MHTHTPEINAWIESQGRALEEAWHGNLTFDTPNAQRRLVPDAAALKFQCAQKG